MYYKDMEVWKESMELTVAIYRLTEVFPKSEVYGLASQMRRSAVSIPSNIAEGSVRTSGKETFHFIDIALGSVAELETQVILSVELGYVDEVQFVSGKIKKVNALLQGLKKYLSCINS